MKKNNSNKLNLTEYKKMLLEKRARITGDVEQLESETLHNSQRESSGDLSAYAWHMADVGSDAAERETLLGLASSEQKLVDRITHALERIEQGTYGACELCNARISVERLDARPESTICMKCMRKYDL